jgi:pyridoxamine 5'-phosphate oxidase
MATNEYLKKLRNDFSKQTLSKKDLVSDPFQQLKTWIDEAVKGEVLEPIATTISTVSKYGQPSSRIVYVRDIPENGLVFFTNYHSKKGTDLSINAHACMNFFWPELERQIRVEGIIEKVEDAVSDDYFNARPKSSQVGAWASHQSEKLSSREELEQRVAELTKKYENTDVPRPPHWGGYILVPHYFEFWQGRPSRLHDRIAYSREEESWQIDRLNP